MKRNVSANQLSNQKKQKAAGDRLTTSHGIPLGDKTNSLSAGPRGPVLIQDTQLIDEIAHFDRERIPERVVHAKGGGAAGYFEVTHDITMYTKAKIFSAVGKRTKMRVRCSTVGGESGSADTARDPRGFALKFYTEDGNWDLVGNNTPIFFIRDPVFFPSFIHTQKRNPTTHLKDKDMFWDFIGLRPETTQQVTFLFSDRGTPDGFRHMDGFGSHTFKLVNADNKPVYCKFHYKTNQGIKNLDAAAADALAGTNPDYAIEDLYSAIATGDFPSWSLYIQVMSFEQAERWYYNPFDVTKVWPHGEFPLIPVGRFTLDTNPANYFAEVEQLAFSPANMVPGIEASPDKMLQGRIFSYPDTHRHRLGANFTHIPVNSPLTPATNYQRDGPMMVTNNQAGAPNYFPNSFGGPDDDPVYKESVFPATGDVARHESANEDNFTQTGIFYRTVMTEEERTRLIDNMARHMVGAKEFIRDRAINNFTLADADYGQRLRAAITAILSTRTKQ